MIDYTKDNSKRENLIQFIKVTQKLLDEDGLKYLSIRKIATASGFHNSTIYFYFQDLDELIMLASISRFQKYSEKLEALNYTSDVYEKFYAIWDCFAESALKYSCIFHNFFFGKHSDNLPDFLNIYYDLFPEERNKFSSDITDITVSLTKDLLEKKCNHPELCSEDLQKRMSEILHFVIDKF